MKKYILKFKLWNKLFFYLIIFIKKLKIMANIQLRIGVFVLLLGQMFLGYNRFMNSQMIAEMYYTKVVSSNQIYGPYGVPGIAWLAERANYDSVLQQIRLLDCTIELIAPLVLLATGWKLIAVVNIIHLVIAPMIMYNPLDAAANGFSKIMQIMTVLQLLGLMLFLAVPDKRK